MQKYKNMKGNTQNVSIDQILPASHSDKTTAPKNEPEFTK